MPETAWAKIIVLRKSSAVSATVIVTFFVAFDAVAIKVFRTDAGDEVCRYHGGRANDAACSTQRRNSDARDRKLGEPFKNHMRYRTFCSAFYRQRPRMQMPEHPRCCHLFQGHTFLQRLQGQQ